MFTSLALASILLENDSIERRVILRHQFKESTSQTLGSGWNLEHRNHEGRLAPDPYK